MSKRRDAADEIDGRKKSRFPGLIEPDQWLRLPCGCVSSGRRSIPVIPLAEAADTAHGGHALLKTDKTAVNGRGARVIHGAPGIILRFRLGHKPNSEDANTECEQDSLHARLLALQG